MRSLKTILNTLAIIILLSASGAAQTRAVQVPTDDEIKTNGYLNGRAIMLFMSGDNNGKYFATQFITGALEGMNSISGGRETLSRLYSHLRREQIIKAVIMYYVNNPEKQYRPVVDVILSGCK